MAQNCVTNQDLDTRHSGKTLPTDLNFLVAICDGMGLGDRGMADHRRWPDDLHRPGAAAVQVTARHFTATLGRLQASRVAQWMQDEHPRLNPEVGQELAEQVLDP